MADFRKYCSEICIHGRVAVGSSAAVLGRVRFFDESYTEGSILCVRADQQIDREVLLLCPPIAVIVFCYDSASCLGELCTLGVPCVVLNGCETRFELCKNKVALVDAERGTITLDPSLETLEHYSATRSSRAPLIDCARGGVLKDITLKNGAPLGVENYLVSASQLQAEDYFESAVGLCERLCPELLILDVATPSGFENDDRIFAERVEAVFRAALYGSVAISLSGFDCEDELSRAMRILHKVFCVLEMEGREFNGYLPRGVTLRAPIWLFRPSPVTNPDFVLLDLDFLLPSLFSLSCEEILKKEKALKKELFSVLERYFANFAPRCDFYLKASRFSHSTLLSDFVRLADIKIVFL